LIPSDPSDHPQSLNFHEVDYSCVRQLYFDVMIESVRMTRGSASEL
jgi:hypothetical protein